MNARLKIIWQAAEKFAADDGWAIANRARPNSRPAVRGEALQRRKWRRMLRRTNGAH